MISYLLRGRVWWERETRHWAIFSSSLKVGMITDIMALWSPYTKIGLDE
jgi:hypothetical protein